MAITSGDEKLKKEKVHIDNWGNIVIENAVIINKNFKGEERRHPETGKIVNSKGATNFCVALNEEVADFLSEFRLPGDPERALNVQVKPPKDKNGNIIEGDPLIFLQVKVNYPDAYPNLWPEIKMFSSKKDRKMTKEDIHEIDGLFINNADVKFRPRAYTMDNGRIGLSATLKKLNFDIVEDDFDAKWGEFPVETLDEEDF